jgi:hypothetical protein
MHKLFGKRPLWIPTRQLEDSIKDDVIEMLYENWAARVQRWAFVLTMLNLRVLSGTRKLMIARIVFIAGWY